MRGSKRLLRFFPVDEEGNTIGLGEYDTAQDAENALETSLMNALDLEVEHGVKVGSKAMSYVKLRNQYGIQVKYVYLGDDGSEASCVYGRYGK